MHLDHYHQIKALPVSPQDKIYCSKITAALNQYIPEEAQKPLQEQIEDLKNLHPENAVQGQGLPGKVYYLRKDRLTVAVALMLLKYAYLDQAGQLEAIVNAASDEARSEASLHLGAFQINARNIDAFIASCVKFIDTTQGPKNTHWPMTPRKEDLQKNISTGSIAIRSMEKTIKEVTEGSMLHPLKAAFKECCAVLRAMPLPSMYEAPER